MLLDEPFAGIDPLSIGDIRHLVKDLKGRGIGVLITDHNVRETLDICDRATSSMAVRCSSRAAPRRWWPMKTCAGSIWAKASRSDAGPGAETWRWDRGWICGNPNRW
jgi:hypothetical protein